MLNSPDVAREMKDVIRARLLDEVAGRAEVREVDLPVAFRRCRSLRTTTRRMHLPATVAEEIADAAADEARTAGD
jgi:hypothetical protein